MFKIRRKLSATMYRVHVSYFNKILQWKQVKQVNVIIHYLVKSAHESFFVEN